MFQDFLEPTKIIIAGCDIVFGLMTAVVVVISNPFSNPYFQLSWGIVEIKDLGVTNPMKKFTYLQILYTNNTMIYEYERDELNKVTEAEYNKKIHSHSVHIFTGFPAGGFIWSQVRRRDSCPI
jgi:hypothetical protein